MGSGYNAFGGIYPPPVSNLIEKGRLEICNEWGLKLKKNPNQLLQKSSFHLSSAQPSLDDHYQVWEIFQTS